MKRFLIGVVLILAPLLCANPQSILEDRIYYPALMRNAQSTSQSAQIDALMTSWFKGDSPGAAIMVIKNGRILHSKGYGFANRETKERFRPDTPSLIGSMAKQFTAMAVMMLAERGKLSYDDALTKFFPEFPAYARKITIRHLLNHTSGLLQLEDLLHKHMKVDFVSGKRGTTEVTAKDVLTAYGKQPVLRFVPGERYEYNTGGYVVLSHVVEKGSGMGFENFVQGSIFGPLGMGNSFFAEEPRLKTARRAVGYYREWYGLKVSDYLAVLKLYNGAGSIFTTLEDLYKWDQALYAEKLVKASTLDEAYTPGKLNDGRSINYGFGWEVLESRGTAYVTHAGGWGGFKSFILRIPSQQFAVICLANSGQLVPWRTTQEIVRIYLGEYLEGMPIPK